MNTELALNQITKSFHEIGLETIMIGNVAAALHGASVTTMGVDFVVRQTPESCRAINFLRNKANIACLK